tara:strand:+ start:5094 stop:5711 length:618 start_codon:yes stop_codon:yes gene_type:complete
MSAPAPNPRKTAGVRALGPVDVARLVATVRQVPEAAWQVENAAKPNRFEALDATQHIVFRFVDSGRDWRSSHDRPAWTYWRGLLEPVLAAAVAPYGYAQGVFPRVMLARMPAGGVIHPHVDGLAAAKWPHKIHVPLITNRHVVSHFGGAEHHFTVGQAVEVNNLGPHWVRNEGTSERVHLIFEYYDADQPDPDWLAPFLASGASR